MKVGEITQNSGNINLEGEIVEKQEARDITTKYGKRMRVANAKLKDESGEIKLTLWGQDADGFSDGDKVKIENGWISEFRGELQVSAGKMGKIIKIEE